MVRDNAVVRLEGLAGLKRTDTGTQDITQKKKCRDKGNAGGKWRNLTQKKNRYNMMQISSLKKRQGYRTQRSVAWPTGKRG